jgi:hypothetical protein
MDIGPVFVIGLGKLAHWLIWENPLYIAFGSGAH